MSIIHEALKKADKKSENLPSYIYPGSFKNKIEKKRDFNWGPIFILLVLVLVTGPIVAPLFSTSIKQADVDSRELASLPATEETLEPSADSRKAQFGMEEMPLSSRLAVGGTIMRAQPPAFRLSGIVLDSQAAFCIINDEIIKQGGQISGAKLTRISADEAELDYQGQKIILTL